MLNNIVEKIKITYEEQDSKKIILILMIGVVIYTSFILLIPGLPRGHDLTFHLSRIAALGDGISLGEFPVRIYPNYFNGYGYANGIFYGDIFLYFPAFLCSLGLSVISAYKIFIITCTILTIISMYICVKSICKYKFAATMSTIIYVMSSYRMVDIFIRAAVGEVVAFIFLPIVILGIYEIIYRNKSKWYIITIGFVGLILSHNISAVIMAGFIFLIVLINIKKFIKEPTRMLYLIIAAFVTVLLVGYFVFPMLEQISIDKFILNTKTVSSEIWNSTMPLYKIILEIPYSLLFLQGVSGIGVVFIAIIFMRTRYKSTKSTEDKYFDVCFIMGLISILVVTRIFPWKTIVKYIKQLSMIQFSWRFYLFATVFLSIGAGVILLKSCRTTEEKIKKSIVILILSIFACSINMFGQYAFYGLMSMKGLHDISIDEYKVGLAEYLPAGTDTEELLERGEIITANNDIEIEFTRIGTSLGINFSSNNFENTFIEVPLIYYLGYTARYDNGEISENLNIVKGNNNIVRIELGSNNEGNIKVRYEGTKIQKISNSISLITFIIFALYLIYYNRKIYKGRLRA